jgi:hypothetical protein
MYSDDESAVTQLVVNAIINRSRESKKEGRNTDKFAHSTHKVAMV